MGAPPARATRASHAMPCRLALVAVLLLAGARALAQDAPTPAPEVGPDAGAAADPDAGVAGADAGPDAATEPAAAAATAAEPSAGAAGASPSPAPADPADAIGWGDETETDSAGFASAEPPAAADAAASENEPGTLDASGHLAHRVALWSERLSGEPLAQARQSADLAIRYKKPLQVGGDRLLLRLVGEGYVEYDFAYLHARERFDQPTLDAYEWNVIGRETYAALSWGALELTFGRQIVPFGQGEILSPLDVVNPRDSREPGLAELDDIRMAVLASRAGLFSGPHRFEALIVHESYFGLRPAPLSDFSPLRKLVQDDPRVRALLAGRTLRYEQLPGRFVRGGGQLYGRYSYAGAGVDLALYAGSTLDKPGIAQAPAREELADRVIAFRLWHPRYTVLGHAGAKPLGAFVLRWELGVDLDRPLAVQEVPDQALSLGMVRRNQLNGLLGFTYSGLTDTRIWLEYAQRVVLDSPERDRGTDATLLHPVEAPAVALRLRHTFLRERCVLTLTGTWVGVDPFVGAFARAELEYELLPALHAGLGYAAYFPSATERGPFYGFEQNDRLYADLRWDFVLD
jgi:hypothetical protein